MNIIKSTTLRNNLSSALKSVEDNKDYLLISKRGKLTSAIVDIDLFEDMLEMSNKDYLKSIKEARAQVKKGDTFTHEEVFGEI